MRLVALHKAHVRWHACMHACIVVHSLTCGAPPPVGMGGVGGEKLRLASGIHARAQLMANCSYTRARSFSHMTCTMGGGVESCWAVRVVLVLLLGKHSSQHSNREANPTHLGIAKQHIGVGANENWVLSACRKQQGSHVGTPARHAERDSTCPITFWPCSSATAAWPSLYINHRKGLPA